jgi:hypothetical protein
VYLRRAQKAAKREARKEIVAVVQVEEDAGLD